jgi:hypothetical protein
LIENRNRGSCRHDDYLDVDMRDARDRGAFLPDEQQAELDALIEAELYATADRAKALLAQAQL